MVATPAEVERTERSLKRAVYKRDAVVEQLEVICNLTSQVKHNRTVLPVLKARARDLESLLLDFRSQQDDILNQLITLGRDSEFAAVHKPVATKFMEDYYLTQVVVSAHDKQDEKPSAPPTSSFNTLPKISLPNFDGTLRQWCSFRDMFVSLVHENPSFSPLQRFHYLLSCVTGSASSVVKAIPLTAANYTIAWTALSERYENQRLLATAHLEQLFSFRPINSESLSALLHFTSVFQENIAAIKALGVEDLAGFMLFFMGSRVLDSTTRHLFENSVSQTSVPTFDVLLKFVQHRCKILENLYGAENNDFRTNKTKSGPPVRSAFATRTSERPVRPKPGASLSELLKSCTYCRGDHGIYQCTSFKTLTVLNRREYVMSHKLCFSCLSSAHLVSVCPSKYTCRSCGQRHHSLLHIQSSEGGPSLDTKTAIPSNPDNSTLADAGNSTSNHAQFAGAARSLNTVLLGTAMVRVRDELGNHHAVRVLIDSGSQISAVTSAFVTRLGLQRRKCHTQIVGLAQQPVAHVKGATSCTVLPHDNSDFEFNCDELIILPRITSLMPANPLPATVRQHYKQFKLADPNFDVPARVDMLIGGDIFLQLLRPRGDIVHIPGLPSALDTLLGWVLVGTVSESDERSPPFTSLSVSVTPPIETLLQQFWNIEEPVPSVAPTTEDELCEKWFVDTTSRDICGRYSVALPFREAVRSHSSLSASRTVSSAVSSVSSYGLGDSRVQALKRLYNLESRLIKDEKLYQAYRQFMEEYLSLGHMKLATTGGKYFIPHHPVVKQDGDLSKIRVVFDASAVTTSGRSLNDVLCIGPKLQVDISEILLQCRLRKFAFTADIEKMYRQILVRPEDCLYQHILWRNSPSDAVQEFELLTVTYGVSSAPFLAIRCLHLLDAQESYRFPTAQGVLTGTTYVDDIIAGADSIEELLQVQDDVICLLRSACCKLKKWTSNCRQALDRVPLEDRVVRPTFDPKVAPAIKVLGLHWEPGADVFGYHINSRLSPLTKRGVLSTIARLFDPVGALGPTILWAKSLLQKLWSENVDWDSPLPPPLQIQWDQFLSQLPSLTDVALPRHINIFHAQDVQLLGFADASQVGYAAIIFLRVVHSSQDPRVYFVTCKTKVAPLNSGSPGSTWSIPRLELCAALLLARVLSRLHHVLLRKVPISRIRAWTDSSIVLSWLAADQKTFKIFVTNRVSKIHALLPQCQWGHITSDNNPADPASRGLLPAAMIADRLHRDGPAFLRLPEDQWPVSSTAPIGVDQLPEVKTFTKVVLMAVEVTSLDLVVSKFSSFTRLQRSTAYALRFVYHRILTKPLVTGPLTSIELNRATSFWVRRTQLSVFPHLVKQLARHVVVTPPSLAQLAPFLDDTGLIRVGGRLNNTTLSWDVKHPLLLPKVSPLTSLLIRHYHVNFLHGGPKLILSMLRQKFWIVSGRDAVRRNIFTCVKCTRQKAVRQAPFMGQLPSARVSSPRVFTQVGMDYGGPYLLKESRRRNAKVSKHYVALFICMAVKAIHVEIVSDLTTEAFLAALDRFVARRGIPSDVYSDCGTNYVGAARQLKMLFNTTHVQNTVSAHLNCNWHFNPPAAPHFGGLWEAAIKSVKYHLNRSIGAQKFTFEEFMTLTTRIEGVLNSRPLTPLSADPNDLDALTPGHFIIGQAIQAIPETDVLSLPSNRLNRWELIRQCTQSFWKRWTREYLTTLQGRSKWFKSESNLKIGDLVIVEAPSQPPSTWRLGRIVRTHPGEDQTVRVVTVRTAAGELKRPVVKLVKLPVED